LRDSSLDEVVNLSHSTCVLVLEMKQTLVWFMTSA
jgi:hypothetical protein